VTFDGAPAPLISVQAGRVVCIVPFGAGSRGDYTTIMQVHNNGVVSNSIRLRTAPTAIELLAVTNQDGTVNSPEQPAKPGSVITIYLAGVGRTDSSVADGQVNGSGLPALQGANVWLGEIAGDILYAGPAPGQVAGVMQINVRVPDLDPDQYRVVVDVNGDGDVIDLSVGK
jgi:uncharacterized protein (TIGR03437 family)